MWMKSHFALWEVEGMVRERVNNALSECERARFQRAASSARARYTLGSLLDTVMDTLWNCVALAASRSLQKPAMTITKGVEE